MEIINQVNKTEKNSLDIPLDNIILKKEEKTKTQNNTYYKGLKNFKNEYYNNSKFEDYTIQKSMNIEKIIFFDAMAGNLDRLQDEIKEIHNKFNYQNKEQLKHYYDNYLLNYKIMSKNCNSYFNVLDKLLNELLNYINKINDKNYFINQYNNIKLKKDELYIKYQQIINQFNILKNINIINFKDTFKDIYAVYHHVHKLKDILIDFKNILYDIHYYHIKLNKYINKIKIIIENNNKILKFQCQYTDFDNVDNNDKKINNKKFLDELADIKNSNKEYFMKTKLINENNIYNENNENKTLKRKNDITKLDDNEIIKKNKINNEKEKEINNLSSDNILKELLNVLSNDKNKEELLNLLKNINQ